MAPETNTAVEIAHSLGIEDELADATDTLEDDEALTLLPVEIDDSEELTGVERFVVNQPVLPGNRRAEDIATGGEAYAFPIVGADGTRKLIRGTITAVDPYDAPFEVNEGSPGFVSLSFSEYPHQYVGLDINRCDFIPVPAMAAFKSEPGFLPEWLSSGSSEGRSDIEGLRAAIMTELSSRRSFAESPTPAPQAERREPLPALEPASPAETQNQGALEIKRLRDIDQDVMAEEYLGSCWRDSLYAIPKREERALLERAKGRNSAAFGKLYERHLGLVAVFVSQANANGQSAELMRRGASVLKKSIRDFQPENGSRLVDYVCERLDEGI